MANPFIFNNANNDNILKGHRGCDRMVVGITTTYATSVYHHYLSCDLESRSWRSVLNTTLCHKVCR
jgi:hypothetical protein